MELGAQTSPAEGGRRWFSVITEEARNAVLKAGVIRNIEANKLILSPRDEPRHLILILSGEADRTLSRPGGAQLLLGIARAGDFVGGVAYLDGGKAVIFATARTQIMACYVPVDRFNRLRREIPIIGETFERTVARNYRNTLRLLELIALAPLDERVRWRLAALAAEQVGQELARFGVDVNINQTELAQMVNSSRSKVNGALSRLEAAGEITTGFRKIRILPAAFLALRATQ
jgi:CRP/FNR family transcriptional regulator, cyclic AMP receptor protein